MLTKSDFSVLKELVDKSVTNAINTAIDTRVPPIIERIVDTKLRIFSDQITTEFVLIHQELGALNNKIDKVAQFTGMINDK